MNQFVGRQSELRALGSLLGQVRSTGRGLLLAVTGRRQVGKSRLIDEFVRRAGADSIFFTASRQSPDRELSLFAEEMRLSSHPAAGLVRDGLVVGSWEAALNLLSSAGRNPAIAVLDEFPYLVEGDPGVEGSLQKVWDRTLEATPTLLVLIGSDVGMMQALGGYGHPLFGRLREMRVGPFSPHDFAALTGLPADRAIDAYALLGGFPRLAASWQPSDTPRRYLSRSFSDPGSPFVVSGEQILAAEFPLGEAPRLVLRAIGGGQPSFSTLERTCGLPQTSLRRTLDLLLRKEVVAVQRPVSTMPSRLTRHRIADTYLRAWLTLVEPHIDLVRRGRSDEAVRRVVERWSTHRGIAVEALVREAVERLLPDERFGDATDVGSYWTRDGSVDVDLVGVDRRDNPRSVGFVGSVKWRERAPFGSRDTAALLDAGRIVPGAGPGTRLVGVSRTGFAARALDVRLGPDDVMGAWA